MGRPGRLARAAARHPAITIAVWAAIIGGIVTVALAGVGGQGLFSRLDSGWTWAEGESTHADELLSGGDDQSSTLLVHGVDTADPELTGLTAALAAELAELPEVTVVDPLALPRLPDGTPPPQAARLFADDGDGFLLPATVAAVDGSVDDTTVDEVDARLTDAAERIRDRFPGAVAEVGSTALLVDSIVSLSENDLQRGETVALPIALLVMLVVFGGFLAAGLPLVGAIVSITGGLGALFGFTYLMDINTTVVNVVTAVGLGLSIDYGLLIVSRFREEAHAHVPADRLSAIVRAADTAGRTVLYSGTVFAIASLGLLLFPLPIVQAIGLGALSVTVISILSALTLLPALLAVLGAPLLRPGLLTRIPGVGALLRRFGDVAPEEGLFSRLTRRVQRHPALVTLACAAALVLLAAPVLQLRLANTSVDSLPATSQQYGFQSALRAHFPAAADQRVVLVTETEADAESWAEQVARLPHVVSVAAPEQAGEAWQAAVRVAHRTGADVVAAIRADRPGFPHWVTGADARTVDFAATLAAGAPWAALVIALGTIVLLFLMTGSLVVPIKALLASALSLGASLGVLVWGFQDGNFAGFMRFDPDDVLGVDVLVVLLTLVFGFGLAMDYEMFILSRITEQVERGVPDAEAIARGLQRSGRIITSAALIIIVVFAGFATGDLMVIKQLGTALAVAVFLDATIVRCLLVPAFMTWQRRIMWWAPAPLKRLHARFALRD
ncbi:MMPL family transporter [Protaetiibacter larvae]|uniref:MMPL family transporter n=1 Tax=Protaetiibacter larvae TaxID=2592654 RepID=A0A5C1YBV7_9MICO|nr:MMPL family transporter [Protaetiibacter larvae]